MKQKQLTLQEIKVRQQQLEQESQEDEMALLMGVMGKPEIIERQVRREVELRWLQMEALLARNSKTYILH